MNFTEMLGYFIGLLHTIIRFIPLGIYFFAYFSSAIYKDIRSAILLIGLIINDLLGYLFKRYTNFRPNDACAVFDKKDDESELGFLPNQHSQIIAFVSSFYFSDMYYKQKLDIIPFTTLMVLIFLTIWSRINIGCETSKNILVSIIFGIIPGMLFYYFVKNYYLEAEKGIIETNRCDLGYDNYNCSEIKDGTVIIKNPIENEENED